MKHVLYEVGSDESDEDDSEVEEEEWNENWTPGTINRPSQMWLDWVAIAIPSRQLSLRQSTGPSKRECFNGSDR